MSGAISRGRAVSGATQPPLSNFVLFTAGQGISAFGTWMQKTGVGWMAWELTHSPAWVGALVLSDVLAAVWVGPLAGTVTDRSNPFRLILTTQSLAIVQATSLALLAWSGTLSILALFLLTLIDTTIQGFNLPVRMTIISRLVRHERLSQAIASNSVTFNLARTIAPAIGGVAIDHGGVALIFMFNALSTFALLAAVIHLRRWISRPGLSETRHVWIELAEGIRYIRTSPEILRLFLVTVIVSLFARPFAEMFPALAGAVFEGGPETLAMLMSSQGAGALIGAGWMLWQRSGEAGLFTITLGGALGLSAALIVFCTSIDPKVAIPAMILAGACHVIFLIGMQSMIQMKADPAMKGRVTSAYWLLFRCSPSLGAFVIGLATAVLGLQWLIGGGAAVAALCTLLFAARHRHDPARRPHPAP